MRTARTAIATLLALGLLGQAGSAQSLTISLFERYLEAIRVQAGIPAISAAIVQNGQVWDSGFGHKDLEASVRATATTPYPILDLSQTLASTLLLQRCLDAGRLALSDRVRQWLAEYPESEATIGHLLTHTRPSGGFRYDPARYAALSGVVEQCTSDPYAQVLTEEVFDRLGMVDSVPSHDLSEHGALYPSEVRERYAAILGRLAVPYRVDANRRAVRAEYQPRRVDASTGIVSSARDLARFDAALSVGVLASRTALEAAWNTDGARPTGLGWFVQPYNGERLVWHFGLAEGAYSSLVLKVPGRGLTLILLANSDGLSAPYNLANGDVTASLFARLFLRLFVA
ncbi:MAG: beta-lactamase family protein [Acidobacteria bacterium]|nr:beta-lactamase family protein [Acidobacteriota bacterium]